eukprot:COSAG01_NODE_441_length_17032_cov_27.546389_2_plen_157_part_00
MESREGAVVVALGPRHSEQVLVAGGSIMWEARGGPGWPRRGSERGAPTVLRSAERKAAQVRGRKVGKGVGRGSAAGSQSGGHLSAAEEQQRADAANAARVERMVPQRKSYIQPRASFVPPSSPPPRTRPRHGRAAKGDQPPPLTIVDLGRVRTTSS